MSEPAKIETSYIDLVYSFHANNYWKNLKIEDAMHLAHCNTTNANFFDNIPSGNIFAIRADSEISEKTGKTTSVNKMLGLGGSKVDYIIFKGEKLITKIDFTPTFSIIIQASGAGLSGYKIPITYWNTKNSNSTVIFSCSYGSTKNYIISAGKYFMVKMYINNDGEEVVLTQTTSADIPNIIGNINPQISSISPISFDFTSLIKERNLSNKAYTSKIEFIESDTESFSNSFSTFCCGMKFYADDSSGGEEEYIPKTPESDKIILSNKNTPIDPSDPSKLKLTKGVKVGDEEVIDDEGDIPKKVSKVKGLSLSPNFFTDEEQEAMESLASKLTKDGNFEIVVLGYINYVPESEEYKFYKERTGNGTDNDPYVYSGWIQYNSKLIYKDLATNNLYIWNPEVGYKRLLTEDDFNILERRIAALEK